MPYDTVSYIAMNEKFCMSMGFAASRDDYVPARIWKRQEIVFLQRHYRDIQYEREPDYSMSLDDIEEMIDRDARLDAAIAIGRETGLKIDPDELEWTWR